MDILTHTLSGMAVGGVGAAFCKKVKPIYFFLLGAIGGALPDIDAISLWSKFDSTFGNLFGLTTKGSVIYSAKLWYSHHAFFHSIVAALLFTIVLALLIICIRRFRKNKTTGLRNYFPLFLSFFFAYCLHLIEDMPTPASTWGGVRLFFPAKTYVGGSGQIWWWNNYDIFLVAVLVVVVITLLLFVFRNRRKVLKYCCVGIFALGVSVSIYQINTRQTDYAYKGYTKTFHEFEKESLKEQERILGKPLYKTMCWIDRHIPANF